MTKIIKYKYTSPPLDENKAMFLKIPMRLLYDMHPSFGPNMIQTKLDDGWVIDGEMFEDYATQQFIVPLRKL